MIDREEFENLDAEKQVEVFRESSIREKGELFLRCHDPGRIARALSGEEFYLITREMDMEEKTEILQYATLPQLFFLSDVECWRGDRIHAAGFVTWLETLHEADDRKLLAWLLQIDYETAVAGLKQIIRVLKPEWEYAADESLGDGTSFTLDQYYYISVREENFETVKRVLEVLFENHRGRYTALLEGVLSELDYEIEEEAFRNRGERLEEHGFPGPETARQIFHPISKQEFESFPEKNGQNPSESVTTRKTEKFSMISAAARQNLFLDDVLLALREEDAAISEGVEEELIWLSNKVIAAEGIDFSAAVTEEKIRQGADKTRRILSLGLELVSHGDISEAVRLMSKKWLESISRLAITRLYEIRKSAESIVQECWKGETRRFLEFLNPPYEIIFRDLFSTVPQFFDDSISENQNQTRDFTTLLDVERAERSVDQMALIHGFLSFKIPQIYEEIHRGRSEDLTWRLFEALATLYASFVLNGTISIRALSEAHVLQFMEKGFDKKDDMRILNPQKKKAFFDQFFTPAQQETLRTLWAFVFNEMESELGRLKISKKFDPRFVSILRIHRRKNATPL